MESEKRAEAEAERLALAKRLNLSCSSTLQDDEEKAREQKIEEEMDELLNDAFMQVVSLFCLSSLGMYINCFIP